MPEPRHWYLFLYDVTDPARLRQTHKLLTGWGKPVQYSVFRARCTADDRLMVVRLCHGCASRVSVHGEAIASFDLDTPPFHIV